MYLSKGRIIFSKLISSILILGCLFVIVLGISGIGLVISAMGGNYEYIEKDEIGSSLAVYIVFIVIPGALALWAANNLRLTGKANRLNNIFEGDQDGYIPFESLGRMMNTSPDAAKRLFERLVHKGFIIGCTMECDPVLRIVLSEKVMQTAANTVPQNSYSVVSCPGCGASQSVRSGETVKCSYCGKFLRGK